MDHIKACWLLLSAVTLQICLVVAMPPLRDDGKIIDYFNEVCYDGIGCFRRDGDFFDWQNRPISLLPQSPQKIDTKFVLFTRSNWKIGQSLVFNRSETIINSQFLADRETKILIHGFGQNGDAPFLPPMRDSLLDLGDYNVIVVDWGGGSAFPYTQATANTRVAGAIIAQMIQWLQSEFNLDKSRIHIIGHSLGAHVAGYAGERVSGGIARITGTDPAGPYFAGMPPSVRLDETDARFVDVIHTDGNSTWNIVTQGTGFGLMQPLGHVDFYPNGGRFQPGCEKSFSTKAEIDPRYLHFCHHGRAHQLMRATIFNSQRSYKAFPCESYAKFKAGGCRSCGSSGCASMGIKAADWNPRGKVNVRMFLDTTDAEPFEISEN